MAGSPPPVRRPGTVRPRTDRPIDADRDPPPPSRQELERIEEQLTELAGLAGASVARDPALGAWLVTWPGRGPALNHLERVRWPSSPAEIDARIERLALRLGVSRDRPAVAVARGLTEPPDLGARLVGLGWHPVLHELILWTRRAAIVPHLDPLSRVEAVTPATAPAYEALERSIFRLEGSLAEARLSAMRRAIEAGRLRAYLVRLVEEPIATARLWTFGAWRASTAWVSCPALGAADTARSWRRSPPVPPSPRAPPGLAGGRERQRRRPRDVRAARLPVRVRVAALRPVIARLTARRVRGAAGAGR